MMHFAKIVRVLRTALLPVLCLLVGSAVSAAAKNAAAPPGPPAVYKTCLDAEDRIAGWRCVHKARAQAANNQDGASIFWYLEAVKRYPPLKAVLAREIGYLYAKTGDDEAAAAWYNLCVTLRPDDVEARLGLARALGRSRRFDRALEHYQAVISISNGLPLDLDLEIDKVTAWKNEK